jgi:hypothetical protein
MPAFRDIGVPKGYGNADVVAAPAELEVGDIVFVLGYNNSSQSWVGGFPAGWTVVGSNPEIFGAGTTRAVLAWHRIAEGEEDTASWNIECASEANSHQLQAIAYRGLADEGSPIRSYQIVDGTSNPYNHHIDDAVSGDMLLHAVACFTANGVVAGGITGFTRREAGSGDADYMFFEDRVNGITGDLDYAVTGMWSTGRRPISYLLDLIPGEGGGEFGQVVIGGERTPVVEASVVFGGVKVPLVSISVVEGGQKHTPV